MSRQAFVINRASVSGELQKLRVYTGSDWSCGRAREAAISNLIDQRSGGLPRRATKDP
jgi:hypothetical protein